MAAGAVHRRKEQQRDSRQGRSAHFADVVNAGRIAGELVGNGQSPPARDAPQAREQPRPLGGRHVAVENEHAAVARQLPNQSKQVVAQPIVGDQPLARDSGLAAFHRRTYSQFA